MEFLAELKKVEGKGKNLDMIYSITFETDNPMILDLGKLPKDTVFIVNISKDN
jgi:uncharacterized protein related to proFAR isomerase